MQISDGELERCAILIKHEVFHYTNGRDSEANNSYNFVVVDIAAFCEALLLANATSHWRPSRRRTLEVSVFDKAGETDAGKVPDFNSGNDFAGALRKQQAASKKLLYRFVRSQNDITVQTGKHAREHTQWHQAMFGSNSSKHLSCRTLDSRTGQCISLGVSCNGGES